MEQQQPRLTVEWRDSTGSIGLTHMNCRADLTVAEIESGAAALRSLLIPLSNAFIVGQIITFKGVAMPRPIATTPGVSGDAGMLIFDTVGDGYFYASIPALKSELLEATGCAAGVRIALDSPPVAALSGALQLLFCDPFGAAILGPKAGMLQRLWRGR